MSSPLLQSTLAALQSALSVLLTISYGVAAAHAGLIGEVTEKEMSRASVKLFLPALIVTQIGKHLAEQSSSLIDFWPVLAWGFIYPCICLALIYPAVRWLKFPSWALAVVPFNNTTALPLLLLQSLTTTGILDSIAGGSASAAQERATTFFLINSMVSNGLTFALGENLLGKAQASKQDADMHPEDGAADGEQHPADGEAPDEHTTLLQKKVVQPVKRVPAIVQEHIHAFAQKLPRPVYATLDFMGGMISPPFVGAILAVFVGETPGLKTWMFASPQAGGVLRTWFTSSLENIGGLYTALQMFVVGAKLNKSIQNMGSNDDSNDDDPKRDKILKVWPVLTMLIIRYVLMPALSIALIYTLATRTTLLGSDPVLWFVLMFMAGGPSATNMVSLAEVAGEGELVQEAIARFITISYLLTPLVSFAVVGALKASEAAMDQRGL